MPSGAASPLRVVCGLGNPGDQYRETRHNVGFAVVESLAKRAGAVLTDGPCRSRWARVRLDQEPAGDGLMLVAPQTYMNRSGYTLRCLTERFSLPPEQVLVVYDEIHLPLGRLRLRKKGSPAGHRGLESILENLGTDLVPRLRLGVGGPEGPEPGADLVDFVLAPFAPSERDGVEEMIERAADACTAWARLGAEAAMQEFNG